MECLLDFDGHMLLPTPGDAWFVSGRRMDVIRGRPFNDCVPCWQFYSKVDGVRLEDREPEDCEPGGIRSGWQHEAASRVEQQFREGLFEHIWQCRGKLWSGRKGVQERGCRSRRAHQLSHYVLHSSSVFSSCGVLGCLFPLLRVSAGVAIHSIRAGVLGRRGHAVESAAGRIWGGPNWPLKRRW